VKAAEPASAGAVKDADRKRTWQASSKGKVVNPSLERIMPFELMW
jgi:hypothetical protein